MNMKRAMARRAKDRENLMAICICNMALDLSQKDVLGKVTSRRLNVCRQKRLFPTRGQTRKSENAEHQKRRLGQRHRCNRFNLCICIFLLICKAASSNILLRVKRTLNLSLLKCFNAKILLISFSLHYYTLL